VGLFLVFEYVPGPHADGPESLRDRLGKAPVSLGELARLARDLGAALTFAHAEGIIHRDIKPENILFSRTGAKIADFGIARIPDSTITRVNTVLGTPAYTSPEALAKGEFGPASDQFAFAATLYEAASGARAFGGDDPIVTAGLVSTEPPAPLEARPGDAAVVRALNAALAKGMAKEVQDRFASCVALGEAVARAVERPGDGVALDPLLEAAVAIRFDAGAAEHIEIERTPLGSRLVLERAVRRSTPPISMPPGETPAPRPSFVIRRQTNRWQNITAAIALAVIVGLILIGRRSNEGSATQDVARPDAASARPTATAKRLAPPAVIAAHATPSSPGAASDAGAAGPDGAATGGPEGGDR
jgi:serine/threonine-protein kinase